MALIVCPECGKQISDKAKTCNGCGCPITSTSTPKAETETPPINANRSSITQEDLEVTSARMKSYVGPAIFIFFMYCLFYIPGVIFNYMYLTDARRMSKIAGRELAGTGCLSFMFWVFFKLPIIGGAIIGFIIGILAGITPIIKSCNERDSSASHSSVSRPDANDESQVTDRNEENSSRNVAATTMEVSSEPEPDVNDEPSLREPETYNRIRFARGATSATVNANFRNEQARGYVLELSEGQNMFISWSPPQNLISIAVYGNNGPLHPRHAVDGYAEYNIPETGDYYIMLNGTENLGIKFDIPSVVEANNVIALSRYRNELIGYEIQYPANFVEGQLSKDRTGKNFHSPDGRAILSTYTDENDWIQDPAGYYEAIRSDIQISARELENSEHRDNWCVFIYSYDGKIYCEKRFITGNTIVGFQFVYPAEQRAYYDGIAASISGSFVPSYRSTGY